MAKFYCLLAVLAFHCLCRLDLIAATQVQSEYSDIEAPKLESFANYEDMQNYFSNRKYRNLRLIENPSSDSYLDAYNRHNEQEAEHKIVKRDLESKHLPSQPVLIKFQPDDAVEPSDEVKQLVRQHRMLEEEQEKQQSESEHVLKIAKETGKSKAKPRKSHSRIKRSAKRQEPSGFQVQMIPFEVSDAREPDEETKKHIKRMRLLDLERATLENSGYERPVRAPKQLLKSIPSTKLWNKPTEATPLYVPTKKTRKYKMAGRGSSSQRTRHLRRARRSATSQQQQQQQQPELFKFELEDAKDPGESYKALYQQQQRGRESKEIKESTLLTMEQPQSNASSRSDMDNSSGSTQELDDQSSHESKRMYFYKEAPHKTKKSINNLPPEVQKVISHLIKEHKGAKAYVKYIPAHKLDHELAQKQHHSTKLSLGSYGTKLQPVSYVKYIEPANQHKEQLQQHLQQQVAVPPLIEKVRYVYTPVQQHQPQPQPQQQHQSYQYVPETMSQPIVVQEPAQLHAQLHTVEPHYSYSSDYAKLLQQQAQLEAQKAIKEISSPQFRPSKPDPTFENNKLVELHSSNDAHHYSAHSSSIPQQLPVNHYEYEVFPKRGEPHISYDKSHLQLLSPPAESEPQHAPATVIKIEYHAAPDHIKEHYKEMEEFKELSSLIGKSPEDQIHGLTYLLAKEMQSKLKLQRQHKQLQQLEAQAHAAPAPTRPQDSTAPIQFHDHHIPLRKHAPVSEHASLGVQPGRLIGMGKVKEYVPIVEAQAAIEPKLVLPVSPAPSSIEQSESHRPYYGLGLSSNYEGVASVKPSSLQQSHAAKEQQVLYRPVIGAKNLHSLSTVHSAPLEVAKEQEHSKAIHFGAQHGGDSKLQYASKYAFGYRIRDFHTGNDFGHKQNRDLSGVTRGQYHILLPDGRIQNVIYHADDTGFHADVSFETGH